MKAKSRWTPYAFLLPALLGLVIFRVIPIGVAFVNSLYRTTLRGEAVFTGFTHYERLIANPDFWNSVRVTFIFNLIANPLQVALALGLALLVLRPTRGVALFRTAYFVPMTVSIAVTAILWNLLLDPNLGL